VKETDNRVVGWVLAAVLGVHLILLRDGSIALVAAFVALVVGALLRGQRVFVPGWAAVALMIAGLVAVVVTWNGVHYPLVIGQAGGVVGAVLLLRPLTPARGLRVILCVLVILMGAVLRRYSGVGGLFIVVDAMVLLLLAEQIHRPVEAVQSFWVSITRSFRLIVPVSIVVILVFWLFPDYSLQPMPGLTGFGGRTGFDPGQVAELNESRRVAVVATFPEEVPKAEQLYWRGQVFERNEGLRWSRDAGRARARSLQVTAPEAGTELWRYQQVNSSNRGGVIPVLDRVIEIEARRGDLDVAVLDFGASVLSAGGTDALELDVVASSDSMTDVPEEGFGEGSLNVPKSIRNNAGIREIADRLVVPGRSVGKNLEAVAEYWKKGGFTYTMRPGRIPDLARFLINVRKGFCEHFAAASATLLRIGGVPARVVVGYRGGEWNPWLRTITVRDMQAHAWVEAWDAAAGRWVRFDPTLFVAPEMTERMERDLNSDAWPWYRVAAAFFAAVVTWVGDRLELLMSVIGDSELWDALQPVIFFGLLLVLTAWLVRRLVIRYLEKTRNLAGTLLSELERRAARVGRGRAAGETPLAWLGRLGRDAGPIEEGWIARFAAAYGATVYSVSGMNAGSVVELRTCERVLKKLWRHGRS